VDKKVIDIHRYLSGAPEEEGGRTFSVWGGEGARARFALPVWRAIILLDGERGGIVQLPCCGGGPRPFFLLDLVKEPVRVDCGRTPLEALREEEVPALIFNAGGELVVLLGRDEVGAWFLRVWGGRVKHPLGDRQRESLLFLAGECAGLLFFRELAENRV
jgi:hypothetical protein